MILFGILIAILILSLLIGFKALNSEWDGMVGIALAIGLIDLLVMVVVALILPSERESQRRTLARMEELRPLLESEDGNLRPELSHVVKEAFEHNMQIENMKSKNKTLWHDWFVVDEWESAKPIRMRLTKEPAPLK